MKPFYLILLSLLIAFLCIAWMDWYALFPIAFIGYLWFIAWEKSKNSKSGV